MHHRIFWTRAQDMLANMPAAHSGDNTILTKWTLIWVSATLHPMAKKKLQGQVAIVTGSGRGIGAAVAERLAAAGAKLILTARSEEEVENAAASLRRQGAQALAVPGDVSDPATVEEIVETALEEFDRVDILVNNAAVIWPLEETVYADPDEWAYNITTNLIAPFTLVRNVLPVMVDQHYGRILNVSSDAAFTPLFGASAYCAAKAGLDMFARVLALEIAGSGVSINTLYPGHVDTAMQEDIRSVDTTDTRLDTSWFHAAHARGELVAPASVADLACWLVGPWSRNRNGEFFNAVDAAWVEQVRRELA
ncbi:MAG: SDR family oxidoreductase [Anaerolineales bacterium]|nr:SDR family oxidoreductase [Anaerolineales bacterium]